MRGFFVLLFVVLGVQSMAEPLFYSSVTSNDIDYITKRDPSAYGCKTYIGTDLKEMPDGQGGPLMRDGTHVFELHFKDGVEMQVWVSAAVGSERSAAKQVVKIQQPLGKLPTMMRREIGHVVIHQGDRGAFAEDQGHFFVLHTNNIAKRISTHDLEETVFHEAMHASVQSKLLKSSKWRSAVRKDKGHVTEYSQTDAQEDFAETGLMIYTYLRDPDRLPANVRSAMERTIPNRIAFWRSRFPETGKEFFRVASYGEC